MCVRLSTSLGRTTGGYPLRCDENSAERIDTKGVAERPLRRRVRKEQKRQRLDTGGESLGEARR